MRSSYQDISSNSDLFGFSESLSIYLPMSSANSVSASRSSQTVSPFDIFWLVLLILAVRLPSLFSFPFASILLKTSLSCLGILLLVTGLSLLASTSVRWASRLCLAVALAAWHRAVLLDMEAVDSYRGIRKHCFTMECMLSEKSITLPPL